MSRPRSTFLLVGIVCFCSVSPAQTQQTQIQRQEDQQNILRIPGQRILATPQGRSSVVEGEDLLSAARATNGRVDRQQMTPFGRSWRGDAQLFWLPTGPGARLEVNVTVPSAGNYQLAGYFTKAPDYGIFQVGAHGRMAGQFDGYDPRVVHSGRVVLGKVPLQAGNNTLIFVVAGKDRRSTGYLVGVDALELVPLRAESASDPQIQSRPTPLPAAVPQKLRVPGRMLPKLGLLQGAEALESDLGQISNGASWQQYLQVPELKRLATVSPERMDTSSRARLRAILARFDTVSRDPQYQAIFDRPAFRSLHENLRESLQPFALPGFGGKGPNGALEFRWGGYADTSLNFSDFFNSDHTILVRFMPQYPYAYRGPLLTVNGSGAYWIGQGEVPSSSGERPRIIVRVGGKEQKYVVPNLTPGQWSHIAVVRSGNTFRTYLEGQELSPPLTIAAGEPNLPNGILRLGRIAPVAGPGDVNAQFYGFVDDVAVFRRAIPTQAAQGGSETIYSLYLGQNLNGRLTGYEQDLYAGWNFDAPSGLTAQSAPMGLIGPVGLVQVSPQRDSGADRALLPLPAQQVAMQLPFPPGQAWEVIQGCDAAPGFPSPKNSHTGYASFCWDFILAGKNQSATNGLPFYAAAPGVITYVEQGLPSGPTGSNYVMVKHADREYAGYLHLVQGSWSKVFTGYMFLPQALPGGVQIQAGQELGAVGDTGVNVGAYHLHFAVSNGPEGTAFVTIPAAFSNYEVSRDKGKTWQQVSRGIPKLTEWVRRPGN